MAVVQTGSSEYFTDWTDVGPYSLTVPLDAEAAVVMFGDMYPWSSNWMAANPVEINSVNVPTVQKTDEQTSNWQLWAGVLAEPDTGAQDLDYTFGQDPDSGLCCIVDYYKGNDVTTPVGDSAQELTANTDITGLTANSGDMMVGFVGSQTNITSVTDGGQTQIDLQGEFNNYAIGAACLDGATGFAYTGGSTQTAIALILSQAAGAPAAPAGKVRIVFTGA